MVDPKVIAAPLAVRADLKCIAAALSKIDDGTMLQEDLAVQIQPLCHAAFEAAGGALVAQAWDTVSEERKQELEFKINLTSVRNWRANGMRRY